MLSARSVSRLIRVHSSSASVRSQAADADRAGRRPDLQIGHSVVVGDRARVRSAGSARGRSGTTVRLTKTIPCWMSISVGEIAYQNTRYRIGGSTTHRRRRQRVTTMATTAHEQAGHADRQHPGNAGEQHQRRQHREGDPPAPVARPPPVAGGVERTARRRPSGGGDCMLGASAAAAVGPSAWFDGAACCTSSRSRGALLSVERRGTRRASGWSPAAPGGSPVAGWLVTGVSVRRGDNSERRSREDQSPPGPVLLGAVDSVAAASSAVGRVRRRPRRVGRGQVTGRARMARRPRRRPGAVSARFGGVRLRLAQRQAAAGHRGQPRQVTGSHHRQPQPTAVEPDRDRPPGAVELQAGPCPPTPSCGDRAGVCTVTPGGSATVRV